MGNPIQYSDLFLPDVEAGLKEIQDLAISLNANYQELAKTLTTGITSTNTAIKAQNDLLSQNKTILDGLSVSQKGAADTLVKVSAATDQATSNTKKLKDEQSNLKDVFNLSTASIDQIKARVVELTKEYTSMAGATDKTNQQTQKARLEIAQLKLVQDGLNATMKNATLSIKGAEGSYNQMNATLIRLKQELKDLPNSINAQTGAWNKNNPEVKKHLDTINELDKSLKKVDASMGDHQREVGNYAEEIKKALYDLIPFGSELGRVGHAVEELSPAIATGVESIGGLGLALTTIPFAALGVGFGSLIAYFTGTQDGMDKVTRAVTPFKVAMKQALGELQDVGRGIADLFDPTKIKGIAPNSIKNVFANQNAKGGVTLGGEGTLTPDQEKNRQLANDIVNLQIKIEENENRLILTTGELNRKFQEQSEIARDTLLVGIEGEQQRKDAAAAAISTSKELEKVRTDDLNDQINLLELQQSINHNDAERRDNIKEINTLTASRDQIAADALKERRRIESLSNNLELADIKALAEEEKKRAAAQKKFFEEQVKDSLKLFDAEKKQSDADQKAKDDLAKQVKDLNEKNQKLLEANGKAFSKDLEDKKKDFEAFADATEKSVEEHSEKSVKQLEETFKMLEENAKMIGKLFGAEFGNLFTDLTNDLNKFADHTELTMQDVAQIAIDAAGSIDEAFKKGTDDRISALELEKQAQIDIAGTNATARLAIEKTYNDKIRAEKQKQARIDKETAEFQIVINTAAAASKVAYNPILFALTLALGAAELAAVIARPIPQFAGGTQNAPAGLAEVAEQGAEAIQSPTGHLRIAHKRQITYLEKGSKVFTAAETQKMLDIQQIDRTTELHHSLTAKLRNAHREEQISTMAAAFYGARVSEDAISRGVGREIAKLPLQNFTLDQRGYSRFIQTESTRTKVLNERYSLK